MPHYHNFGWYYFAKYILGLAGMLFLYSGFLKEGSVCCVCPSEDRGNERRKEGNNEYRPTGYPTGAPATTEPNPRCRETADARNQRVTRTNLEKDAIIPAKNLRTMYPGGKSLPSIDRKIDTRYGQRDSPSRSRRGSKYLGEKEPNRTTEESVSSLSSRSTKCLQILNEKHPIGSILNAVARANHRLRNSFAAQENLELEAFVRSITDRKLSSNTSRREILYETNTSSDDEDSCETSANENYEYARYRVVRQEAPIVPYRTCKRHRRESPIISVPSRSGPVYLRTSSRGRKRRAECKIHGGRYREERRTRNRLAPCRIPEGLDRTNHQIQDFQTSKYRRKIGEGRVARYRSAMIFTL